MPTRHTHKVAQSVPL